MLLFVTGFMGAGKSTFARAAARRYREMLFDTDLILEKRWLKTAGEQVAEDLQLFRAREADLLKELCLSDRGGIIALGGGAVEHSASMALLAGKPVLFLDPGLEICWKRVQADAQVRPLAADYQSFAALYVRRMPLYLSICRWHLQENLAPEELLEHAERLFIPTG